MGAALVSKVSASLPPVFGGAPQAEVTMVPALDRLSHWSDPKQDQI